MNQQNNNQAAVLPRRSRRLATLIPASHWISIGYSNENAQLMEDLQNDIKKYCDDSRGDETSITILGRYYSFNPIPHHDMLLPHWQKLAKYLQSGSVVDLQITTISLPTSVLDILFPVLQSINLTNLELCGLDYDGLLRLTYFLKESTSLLGIGVGGPFDVSIARSFSDKVRNHPTLKVLRMRRCGLSNISILEIILKGCTSMKGLAIEGDNLGSDGAPLIANFIRGNYPLEMLGLGCNTISDSDTSILASALKENTNLYWLDLNENNNITEEGEKNLLKALFDPTSMNSIIESNHKCRVFLYDFDNTSITQRPPLEQELFSINTDDDISIQQKIRKKIVLALCGVDGSLFDLSHLNDLPLQLMPRVLELVQEHSWTRTTSVNNMPHQLEKDALSRLFHTLRGWELPVLFENLNRPSANAKRKRRKTRR